MVVAEISKGIDIPESRAVYCRIEHECHVCVPVAIYVDRLYGTCTGESIVSHAVTNAVACIGEVDKGHDGPLVVLYICIVEQAEVVGKRGFQSRVTHSDIERVAVIYDIYQVAH